MKVVVVLLAFCSAFVIMLPGLHLMKVTPDGANYLSIARNLADHFKPVNHLGHAENSHPWGYSVAMAPLLRIGLDHQDAAYWVNFAGVMMVFIFGWLILKRWTGYGWQAVAGALAVTFTPSLFNYATQTLSETLFMGVGMAFLWACLHVGSDWRWTLATAALGFALTFTRYPGIGIVVGAGLMLSGWRNKALVILPALVVFLVVTWNFKDTTRGYVPSANWGLLLPHIWTSVWVIMALVTGTIAAALMVWLVRGTWQDLPTRLIVVVIPIYLAVIIYASVKVANPVIALDDRLYAVTSVLCFLLLVGTLLRRLPEAFPYVLVGLLVYAVLSNVPNGRILATPTNKSFNAPSWRDSKIVEIIKSTPDSVQVFTNASDGVWFLTGREARQLPSDSVLRDSVYGIEHKVVAWFNYRRMRPLSVSPESLLTRIWRVGKMNLIREYHDSTGIIVELVVR